MLSIDVGRDSNFSLHRHHPNPTNKKSNSGLEGHRYRRHHAGAGIFGDHPSALLTIAPSLLLSATAFIEAAGCWCIWETNVCILPIGTIYVRVSLYSWNMPNNPNTYHPSHTCLGYVWVGILSLIVALLLYTPWRLSRDNYDAWQWPEANWNISLGYLPCRSKSIHRWLAYAPLSLRFIDMLTDIRSLKEVLSKIYQSHVWDWAWTPNDLPSIKHHAANINSRPTMVALIGEMTCDEGWWIEIDVWCLMMFTHSIWQPFFFLEKPGPTRKNRLPIFLHGSRLFRTRYY